MYELTIGDQRYIGEALTTWNMYINPIINAMNEVPDEVADRLEGLKSQYIDEFSVFFQDKKNEDESLHADEIHDAFDEIWREKHPEFFEMDKLFAGCSDSLLSSAEKAISEAKVVFTK